MDHMISQVFDLGEESPQSVLRRVYLNLERLKKNGDEFAPQLEKKLRIIVSSAMKKKSLFLVLFGDYWNLVTVKSIYFSWKRRLFCNVQVAGGDGTAGWLLGVVSDLKLSQPPPIATVPLGTGNNLPFAFGWVNFFSNFVHYLTCQMLSASLSFNFRVRKTPVLTVIQSSRSWSKFGKLKKWR